MSILKLFGSATVGHTGSVMGVALNETDSHLASASFDSTVRIWKLPDLPGRADDEGVGGKRQKVSEQADEFAQIEGHTKGISCVAWPVRCYFRALYARRLSQKRVLTTIMSHIIHSD